MKTPRKIMLQRHGTAVPKLDAIRREVLNVELKDAGQASRRSLTYLISKMETVWKPVLRVVWGEWIWPSRRLWTGLAAVWLLILAANFSMRDHSQPAMAEASPMPEVIMTWQQQERLLAGLMEPEERRAVVPPKHFLPQPRSERQLDIFIT